MRLRDVRISGFRAIPPSVHVETVGTARGRCVRLHWSTGALHLRLPTRAGPRRPMLHAIIGANSAGKSTLLMALNLFFGPAVKLDPMLFHGGRPDEPCVIEATLEGEVEQPTAWHAAFCTPGKRGYTLTVAHVWSAERRHRLIRRVDGSYQRQSLRDRAEVERLLPQWRVIWADHKLNHEASLERKGLLGDLIDALVAQAEGGNGVLARLGALMAEMGRIAARPPAGDRGAVDWTPIEALESRLAQGLASATPRSKTVRLQLGAGLPTLRSIIAQSALSIDDGVELALEQHGLGMQRSLVVSILRTWCDYVRNDRRDYLFAIEEPEIYLHPHANRVLLNVLSEIAGEDQVLFTTHASEFVNRTPLSNIISVYRDGLGSRVVQPKLSHLAAETVVKVQRYLQEDRSDMLFARAVVLVEGQAEFYALPAFARTLGLDLDRAGVSVVFVNGIGNFATYHEILAAFRIPHVILMDGDGEQTVRQRTHAHLADALFVLPHDFEALLVGALTPPRLLAVMNECLARRGKPLRSHLADGRQRAKDLAALGKPLVGRVAGELLNAEEVGKMGAIVGTLEGALALAHNSETGQR